MIDTPNLWINLTMGCLGALVGSFLNVVVYRLPRMLEQTWRHQCTEFLQQDQQHHGTSRAMFNLYTPRSHCRSCQHPIAPKHMIPIISFLFLRGRCPQCQQAIHYRYPMVELSTALIFMLAAYVFPEPMPMIGAALLMSLLLTLSLIDLDTQLLPDQLTLLLLWIGLGFNTMHTFAPLQDAVIGAIAGYTTLWTLYWLFKWCTKKEGIGYGDFKLLAALGAWLGWQALPWILVLASGIGVAIGMGLLCTKKIQWAQTLPFGPYLSLAGVMALLGTTPSWMV